MIIVPTRELAKQIIKSIDDYSKYTNIKRLAILGGVSIKDQEIKISKGLDIVVATTGRLLEHIKNTSINLSSVSTVVIDELDTMLDMGFLEDIEKILPSIRKNRQIMMFSATINSTIKKLAKEFLNDPVVVETTSQRESVNLIEQKIILVDEDKKIDLLPYLIGSRNISQALVFVNMKKDANSLLENLESFGIKSSCIHGDIRQSSRALALRKFKEKKIQVLVATDIAARGIDIQNLPVVINFSLPESIKDFTHRIGRTGRAGKEGLAITFLSVKDYDFMDEIQKELKLNIKKEELEGFETKEKKPKQKKNKAKTLVSNKEKSKNSNFNIKKRRLTNEKKC